MRNNPIFVVLFILIVFLTSSAQAGWSEWIDINNGKAVTAAINNIEKEMGRYAAYKRIQCKYENKRIYLRMYYNVVYTGGIYGIHVGMKDQIDAYIATRRKKRNGFHVRSRSDVDLGNENYSCIIWQKPN